MRRTFRLPPVEFVDRGMLGNIREAIRLLGANFSLFSAIILTIWLPVNLLVEYLALRVPSADAWAVYQANGLVSAILGPIPIAAMLTALARLKAGQRPTYLLAMEGGLFHWRRLFTARFAVGLLVSLGLIAFVVPGIILAVRYFLVECAVVLEGANSSTSRARSTVLSAGRRWQILGSAVLLMIAFAGLSFAVTAVLRLTPLANSFSANAVVDCIMDIALGALTILAFLYYWEAREQERARQPSPSPLPTSDALA